MRVHLSDGDVSALEWDEDQHRLLVFDLPPNEHGDNVLIQAKLTEEEREKLISALGGIPLRLNT